MKILSYIWAGICIGLFVIALGNFISTCNKEVTEYTTDNKLDSLTKQIQFLETGVDSLKVQKQKLISKEHIIYEESRKTIERILLAPDSLQFYITEDLIRQHKQLDSI